MKTEKQDITCNIGGKYRILLADVREINGHDDSLPYEATLFINDKEEDTIYRRVAEVSNDGWGGMSLITPIGTKAREEVDKLRAYIHGNYMWRLTKSLSINLDIEDLCDILASKAVFCGFPSNQSRNVAIHTDILSLAPDHEIYEAEGNPQ